MLAVLESAFNEAWTTLEMSGGRFDEAEARASARGAPLGGGDPSEATKAIILGGTPSGGDFLGLTDTSPLIAP
jgi:hypothetical protein